jgi:hypothetical protein
MMVLLGRQFIYSRVEAQYSPASKDDFQMVYRSPGLPDDLMRLCEEQVKSFRPASPTLVRRQFFTFGEHVILTHTVLVETIREINDRNGRPGIFLCHGLVFYAEDFRAATGNNPFLVFDQYEFLRDSRSLVQGYDQKRGLERPCTLNPVTSAPLDSGWLREAPALVDLAYQAGQLKSQSRYLLFFGDEPEITAALRVLFFLISEGNRLACSFDTSIEQISTAGGRYWAVGAPGFQAGGTFTIDCRSRCLAGSTRPLPADDMYLAWLARHSQYPPDWVIGMVPSIQNISLAFRERTALPPQKTSEDAGMSFMEQFRELTETNLRKYFTEAVSRRAADSLTEYHIRTCPTRVSLLSLAASGKLPAGQLVQVVRGWFGELAPGFKLLGDGEWKNLKKIAAGENDMVLQFWVAAQDDDEKKRLSALDQMEPREYLQALRLLFEPFHPKKFLHPKHILKWLQVMQSELHKYPDGDFVKIVTAVIKNDGIQWLDYLSGRVPLLDDQSLGQLEKQVGKEHDLPAHFMQAMLRRREELGPPAGLLENIKDSLQIKKASKDDRKLNKF